MIEQLEQLLERVREDRHLILSGEEATKQGVVLPILGRLGWDRDNIREVVPEFPVGAGRVDYCLRIGERNAVFVEVKRTNQELERHQEQLLDYAFRFGVEIAVLTNGLVWWLFLPLLSGSWDQRKFFTVSLEQQDPRAAAGHLADFLKRDRIADGSAVRAARQLHESREKDRLVRQTIPRAWEQLCRDPDELLLELFAEKVAGLCGHEPDQALLAEFLTSKATYVPNAATPTAPPPRPAAASATRSIQPQRTSVESSDLYTYKRPVAYTFQGRRYPVSTFKDILLGLSETLLSRNPAEFERALTLRGRKREYFSRDFRSMTTPAEIANSEIYVETNISANNIVNRCHDLLALLGHKRTDLVIEVEPRS